MSTIQKNVDRQRGLAFLEICFDTFCQYGLENTSLKRLADACGVSNAALTYYFGSKDDIVIESTALCMSKVEEDMLRHAPASFADVERFLQEMPERTAKLYGPQYRFMYQVYVSPKYRAYGKPFFQSVSARYRKYAETLAPKLGLPAELIQGMIYIFVRSCVHYALFEDETYLHLQLGAIRTMLQAFADAQNP